MANEQRLNELREEVRELRRDLETTKDELAKASRCYAEHWKQFHQQQVQECEGH